jgi:hypothetical protein
MLTVYRDKRGIFITRQNVERFRPLWFKILEVPNLHGKRQEIRLLYIIDNRRVLRHDLLCRFEVGRSDNGNIEEIPIAGIQDRSSGKDEGSFFSKVVKKRCMLLKDGSRGGVPVGRVFVVIRQFQPTEEETVAVFGFS